MLDLIPFKNVIKELAGDGYSFEGKLNFTLWLGERAHFLVEEIERLRAAKPDPPTPDKEERS